VEEDEKAVAPVVEKGAVVPAVEEEEEEEVEVVVGRDAKKRHVDFDTAEGSIAGKGHR
jgi:hypothetical protein